MIEFDKFILENGLVVIVHRDRSTPLATVNILYNVGSKHEDPDRTGFAHLFEHLMFGGSENIPSYDEPVERANGENNAFTSNDITNYYLTLPTANIETAFWLESDRMHSLAFSQKSLDIQKSVVIEEFNQRYLNQPYGDVWLLLRPLAYKVHPYRWPTIGVSTQHIADATLDDVKKFFFNHYAPNNAVLCVVGDISSNEVKRLSEKWFGPIQNRRLSDEIIPQEPPQSDHRRLEVTRNVPYDAIYMAFHISYRMHSDYPASDLVSDLLSNGKSSRLHQRLVKQKQIFSSIDAFITGDIDPGLLIVNGRLNQGMNIDIAEKEIIHELNNLFDGEILSRELEKVKNKFESTYTFGLTNAQEKAMSLCYNEILGDASLINQTVETYRNVSLDDIKRVANQIFRIENCSTLIYRSESIKS